MFVGSIDVDAFRSLCTSPMPEHVAAWYLIDIFLINLPYSTFLYSVPPDHAVTISSIFLDTPFLLFDSYPSRTDEMEVQHGSNRFVTTSALRAPTSGGFQTLSIVDIAITRTMVRSSADNVHIVVYRRSVPSQ